MASPMTRQSAEHRDRCRPMVEGYVASARPESASLSVSSAWSRPGRDLIAVSGRIDRLDDRVSDDGVSRDLVVVDYKTGRHLLTVDEARTSMALALYALAAERVMRRPCRRVELHHLPTGSVLAWEHTSESLSQALAPGRGDRRGVRPRRRAAQGGLRWRSASRRPLPATAEHWLRLVRLPRPMSRRLRSGRGSAPLGRPQRRIRRERSARLASGAKAGRLSFCGGQDAARRRPAAGVDCRLAPLGGVPELGHDAATLSPAPQRRANAPRPGCRCGRRRAAWPSGPAPSVGHASSFSPYTTIGGQVAGSWRRSRVPRCGRAAEQVSARPRCSGSDRSAASARAGRR